MHLDMVANANLLAQIVMMDFIFQKTLKVVMIAIHRVKHVMVLVQTNAEHVMKANLTKMIIARNVFQIAKYAQIHLYVLNALKVTELMMKVKHVKRFHVAQIAKYVIQEIV